MTGSDTGAEIESQTLGSAKTWLHRHLVANKYPVIFGDKSAAARTIDSLSGLDPESWSRTWLLTAAQFAAAAVASEESDDPVAARHSWFEAYRFAFLGRYPVPNHPAKLAAYDAAREYFMRATRLDDPPVQRLAVPFAARSGENDSLAFYVARPPGVDEPPAVVTWGGIDAWKEESYWLTTAVRDAGFATVHVDMPGVGEAPMLAGVDGERLWDSLFDWLASSDLDSNRVAILGMSFGGYWATKLAHTHKDRVAAAVNWGGGIHLTFQPSWQQRSRDASSYLMDLMAARARIFDGSTFDDYVARCPELSLLDQGILDQPCCPLLLINGKDDLQNDSADIHLALEHGDPKTARLYPGGHMGEDMKAIRDVVVAWLDQQLSPSTR